MRVKPYRWYILAGTLLMIGVFFGNRLLWSTPKVISPSGPSLGTTQISYDRPVKVIFSHPVNRSKLKYAIHPEIKGEWSLDTNWWSGRSTLVFQPHVSPDLGERYTIQLSGIQNLLNRNPQNYLLSFQTETIPTFESIRPAHEATDVLPNEPIVVTFDKPISDGVVITAATDPGLALSEPSVSGNTVTFTHADQYLKGTDYRVEIFLATATLNYLSGEKTINQEQAKISTSTFTTIAAPSIESYTPTGVGVDPATTINLEFQQPMDRPSTEAAFSVVPAVAGSFDWDNDQLMVFTPDQPLIKGQEYTVTLANTATAVSGFTPDEALTWKFSAIGVITVTVWSPGNGAASQDTNTNISVTFNQAVDHESAESKFSIFPATAGSFSWDGNTMIFDPTNPLAYNVTYTVTIAAGVKTIHGLDSVSEFSSTFGTRNQSVLLNVTAFRQAHVYSCMVASARIALNYRGVAVSESSIISRVGQDTTSWSGTWGGSDGVWGDVDSGIVGPLDNAAATSPAGKQTTNVYWGYGSHWGPISAVLTSYGVSNQVRSGMTIQELAQEIAKGNPVMIWWVNGVWPSYEVNWKTPDGKSVRGVNGMHVVVVRGFTGPVENPVSFTTADPGYAYPGRTYDIGTFKARWSWFGNTGIIVQ